MEKKKKSSLILQTFPKLPDLPVNPRGWRISPSIFSSFVLQRELLRYVPLWERLEDFALQLPKEASTCLVNIWSSEVDNSAAPPTPSHAMMWQLHVLSYRQTPQIVTALPKDCHAATDKWSHSSNTLSDSNQWWILHTKIQKGHFHCLLLKQGSRGQGIFHAGAADDLFVLCKVKWETVGKSLSQSASSFVHRLEVFWDPQKKDDTRAQIIIIRASLDSNAVTRNTTTHSYKCFSVSISLETCRATC